MKKAEQAKKKAEKAAEIAKANEFVKDPNDPCADKFGDVEMNTSQCDPEIRFTKKYTAIADINDDLIGTEIRLRGRVHNVRQKGKNSFVVLRDRYDTLQCVMGVGEEPLISAQMVKYSGKIPSESIIELVGVPVKPPGEIKGCSVQLELHIHEIWTISKSHNVLPFQIADASRRVEN